MTDVQVTREPLTYELANRNSFFADLLRSLAREVERDAGLAALEEG